MIYNVSGVSVNNAYKYDGSSAPNAFTLDGVKVFPDSPKQLKVMQYNVGQWYTGEGYNVPTDKFDLYYNIQNGIIGDFDPDILFLEEYWKVFSDNGYTAKELLEQYFPYIHEQGGDSGYMGRCICSKYEIKDYIVNTFANETYRYYDQCTVKIDGYTINLVITHLGTTISAREPQITALLSKLNTFDRFILGGDMNTPYNADPATDAEIQRFANAGYVLANCGDFGRIPTSPGNSWIGWLDNIITSNNIQIVDAYADMRKKTAWDQGLITRYDHMPLAAIIEV